MEALLQQGRYKVIEILYSMPGYKACLCEDVEDKDNRSRFISNIYEDKDYIKYFLPLYYEMEEAKDKLPFFLGLEIGIGNFIAKFTYYEGVSLSSYVSHLHKNDAGARLSLVSPIFKEFLKMNLLPYEIGVCAAQLRNFVVLDKNEQVRINYIVSPADKPKAEYTENFYAGILNELCVKNRYLPEIWTDYMTDLYDGRFSSLIYAYSKWKDIEKPALDEWELLKHESYLQYLKRILFKGKAK